MRETRPPGAARERLLRAALDLFAEHGVSGTSLQMIADRLGVTKAAVYHQFRSKDDIVLAVVDPALTRLGPVADAAERERTTPARRRVALAGVVDLVVEYHRLSGILGFDPVAIRLVRAHPAMRDLHRLRLLLAGPEPDAGAQVRLAMLSGGLVMAGVDPALAALAPDDLRRHLLDTARRTLGVR